MYIIICSILMSSIVGQTYFDNIDSRPLQSGYFYRLPAKVVSFGLDQLSQENSNVLNSNAPVDYGYLSQIVSKSVNYVFFVQDSKDQNTKYQVSVQAQHNGNLAYVGSKPFYILESDDYSSKIEAFALQNLAVERNLDITQFQVTPDESSYKDGVLTFYVNYQKSMFCVKVKQQGAEVFEYLESHPVFMCQNEFLSYGLQKFVLEQHLEWSQVKLLIEGQKQQITDSGLLQSFMVQVNNGKKYEISVLLSINGQFGSTSKEL